MAKDKIVMENLLTANSFWQLLKPVMMDIYVSYHCTELLWGAVVGGQWRTSACNFSKIKESISGSHGLT